MTRNQSRFHSLMICLCWFWAAFRGEGVFDSINVSWLGSLAAAMSVMTHFDAFQRGVIDFRDLVFFLSLMGFALFTTGVIIRSHRAG
jgi:ABC-2 type transport system permease protein